VEDDRVRISLLPGEAIVKKSGATSGGITSGTLMLTDQRLIFSPSAWSMAPGRPLVFAADEITGVEVKSLLGQHRLVLTTTHGVYSFVLSGPFYVPFFASWKARHLAWANEIERLCSLWH